MADTLKLKHHAVKKKLRAHFEALAGHNKELRTQLAAADKQLEQERVGATRRSHRDRRMPGCKIMQGQGAVGERHTHRSMRTLHSDRDCCLHVLLTQVPQCAEASCLCRSRAWRCDAVMGCGMLRRGSGALSRRLWQRAWTRRRAS